jgi:alpha 1,2-mannosyltransferase
MQFGVIPGEHWNQPSWIDDEKFSASRASLEAQGITYGGSITYRNQCRWHSGFFFNHPLLLQYKWYWRVEPDVHFTCDIDFDPFLFMEGENKTYGFTLTYTEEPKTISTLWSTVREFIQANPRSVAEGNALEFMSYDGGKTYNGCHCALFSLHSFLSLTSIPVWNNFEIASLEFYRSDLYRSFFEHLDKAGGFYYEQWGDGVVHSIATSLFLPKEQVHFFENIGYDRSPYAHCPTNIDVWKKEKCSCNRRYSSDYDKRGCLRDWERLW